VGDRSPARAGADHDDVVVLVDCHPGSVPAGGRSPPPPGRMNAVRDPPLWPAAPISSAAGEEPGRTAGDSGGRHRPQVACRRGAAAAGQ
jgi:hypothetical protein